MKNRHFLGLVLGFLIFGISSAAIAAMPATEIPAELKRWKSWVLHGSLEALCPCDYNDGGVAKCRWPTQLKLKIEHRTGHFEQDWLMFTEGWISLPGDGKIWPRNVTVDGETAAVVERNNAPAVLLLPGKHRVMGDFAWQQPPETIPIPPAVGLVSLHIGKKKFDAPIIDANGRLWLQKKDEPTDRHEDRLTVQVFRLLEDGVPMKVTTFLRIYVSGKSREIDLDGGTLPQSIPMAVDSPLPTRMTSRGKLTVQARPGRWEIETSARLEGNQLNIESGQCPHGNEIWSFKPQHDLRLVELQDAPLIEPGQTEMPQKWRQYQAFLIQPDHKLTLKEIRRGDPDPAPDQLDLKRTFWLDFNGRGMTVHDTIGGTLSRQWYLTVNPPIVPGRINVDGRDRVITRQGPEKKMGVELRQGRLDLTADLRLPDFNGSVSAVGWDHDVHSLSGVLHLPPGWRLIAAAGVDKLSDSWVQRWSLLDFFLVLIIALSIYKLRSWRWGFIALAAMVLIYHEPFAPRLVWLHILAVLALLPLLSKGWLKGVITLWGIGAMLFLVAVSITFTIKQIRWGIYPQLRPHYEAYHPRDATLSFNEFADKAAAPESRPLEEDYVTDSSRRALKTPARLSKSLSYQTQSAPSYEEEKTLLQQQDLNAAIPTGPGLPDWRWQSYNLKWNGPVAENQTVKFYLLSPFWNLLLALISVGLLAALIWGLMDLPSLRQRLPFKWTTAAMVLIPATLLVLGKPQISAAQSAEFPPAHLLEELRQRLLEKPSCLPRCADITRMELTATETELQLVLLISSAAETAVPLPANRKSWAPDKIMMDYAPIDGLVRDEKGQLWAFVPTGVHTLVLTQQNLTEEVLQIPLPLPPHNVSYNASGWKVEGIRGDGTVGAGIQLTRSQSDKSQPTAQPPSSLPPFLRVERMLRFGLTWQTATTITRLTPPGTSVVTKIPLLPNESVTSPDIQVENGHALINLAPDQRILTYNANMEVTPAIVIKAPENVVWTETWILAASPIWHCEFSGIAPVHHQDRMGQWQPRWQPWPGETVSIKIHRPEAVSARTKTIDLAAVTLTPGRRFGRGRLDLTMRTSRGGRHAIELPPNAELQKIAVNGRTLPVRQEGQTVSIPLQPGEQRILMTWQQMTPFATIFRTPPISIGKPDAAAANARVTLNMPEQRWILLAGGPRWGPAILFWSYLVAIMIAAFALGRISFLPLSTWHWVLLGLGLTQVPITAALIIAGWLIALGFRQHLSMPQNRFFFDTIQIGLIVWTIAALIALFAAVKAGLIGMPEMQITGNQSTHSVLHWNQDHIQGVLPRPWVLSLSVWVYRALMLAWSLWLALALLSWLKWGWHCINKDGAWRKIIIRRPKRAQTVAVEKGDTK